MTLSTESGYTAFGHTKSGPTESGHATARRLRENPIIPERLLAKLWRAKSGAKLPTTDERIVRVLYPGRPAPGHGPEFQDAVLELDDHPLNGPVELHRIPSDWAAHGHHHDRAYDNVVLHVVVAAPETPDTPPRWSFTHDHGHP